jgi:hypothetical protein
MKTNGQLLQELFETALEEGEVPYQANRAALKELGIFNDMEAGAKNLRATLSGIDSFVATLERFRDGAENVARRALAAVR